MSVLLSLFDVLSRESRCIVYSNERRLILVTWNHGSVLEQWQTKCLRYSPRDPQWSLIDTHILGVKSPTWLDAHKAALQWVQGGKDD